MNCPKCGAARVGGFLEIGDGTHHFECYSWLGNGECEQSNLCRIRELEAQLSSVRAHMDRCRAIVNCPDDETLAVCIQERIQELTDELNTFGKP